MLLQHGDELREQVDHLARHAEAGLRTLDVGGIAEDDALDGEERQRVAAGEDDGAGGVEAALGDGGAGQRVVVEQDAAHEEERQAGREGGRHGGDGGQHQQVGREALADLLLRVTDRRGGHVLLGVEDEETGHVARQPLVEGGVGDLVALEDGGRVVDRVAQHAQVQRVLLLRRGGRPDELAAHHRVQRL